MTGFLWFSSHGIIATNDTTIRQAKTTITFANFVYEKGDIARDMAETLAERCRAGVGVNVLLDAVGSNGMPLHGWHGPR